MELKHSLLTVVGHQNVKSQNEPAIRSLLVSEIKSANLIVETEEPALILFSDKKRFARIFRHDYFSGVKSGEISIMQNVEGQTTINFALDISSSVMEIGLNVLLLLIVWPFVSRIEDYPMIAQELVVILSGIAGFFFGRVWVRYNMKLLIHRIMGEVS